MAKQREEELRDTQGFWGLMHARGFRMMQFHGTEPSALEILDHLVRTQQERGNLVLTIQRELVDEKKELDSTSTGKELRREIDKATEQYQQKLEDLKEEHDDALNRRDAEMAKILEGQRQDFEEKLNEANKAQDELRINMERLNRKRTPSMRSCSPRSQNWWKQVEGLRVDKDKAQQQASQMEEVYNDF
ncbi:hypothetical protein B0H63DRAFT_560043 [Podospora didyma]|uniref:Uncharacterized protein n=1 Tax=Podospora didyma TaxID=330526 RepID=A0AAE0NPQ8_9PEZI|nr:hypothetical protein B0H63DRAFT_560043 [Podospora didyma]